ncbi:MAG: hypothetical protein J6S89_03755 [Paludibacteraceae bacterium]|nr:hypothetical protein [Paludibacteraceae bacterium]
MRRFVILYVFTFVSYMFLSILINNKFGGILHIPYWQPLPYGINIGFPVCYYSFVIDGEVQHGVTHFVSLNLVIIFLFALFVHKTFGGSVKDVLPIEEIKCLRKERRLSCTGKGFLNICRTVVRFIVLLFLILFIFGSFANL